MPYTITEIEVTQPLPTLFLPESDTGIALILRSKDRPIGFLIKALPAKSVLTPKDLARLIGPEIGTNLLHELQNSLQEESVPPANPAQFPSLTVAICTKDRTENLARCLKSLLKLHTPTSRDFFGFEVLVIDNAPSDERTLELCSVLPEVRYSREPKPGLDFARNLALLEARGEFIAFLDDDVTVDRKWLDGLIEAWVENPDAVAFTGQVLPYELITKAQVLSEQSGGFRFGFEKIRYGQTIPGNDLYPCGVGVVGAGCNMAFRREILLKLGGFDEALDAGSPLPGGGDHDIFYRVIRAGYPLVYEPQYLVFHQHRRKYEQLRRQYCRSWGMGLMAFVVKSYQSDPSQRYKFRCLLRWWFKEQLRRLLKSLLGRYSLPPDIIIAELWGGVIGLLGEYPRSRRRTEQIRRQFS